MLYTIFYYENWLVVITYQVLIMTKESNEFDSDTKHMNNNLVCDSSESSEDSANEDIEQCYKIKSVIYDSDAGGVCVDLELDDEIFDFILQPNVDSSGELTNDVDFNYETGENSYAALESYLENWPELFEEISDEIMSAAQAVYDAEVVEKGDIEGYEYDRSLFNIALGGTGIVVFTKEEGDETDSDYYAVCHFDTNAREGGGVLSEVVYFDEDELNDFIDQAHNGTDEDDDYLHSNDVQIIKRAIVIINELAGEVGVSPYF